jgi:hypothetical protein
MIPQFKFLKLYVFFTHKWIIEGTNIKKQIKMESDVYLKIIFQIEF